MRFEFGESLFNGVEIGAIGWQVADPHPPAGKQLAHAGDFVGGKVVENEGVALAQLRTEHLLEIDRKDLGIDRAFDPKGGLDAFVAQGRNEGGALPVAVRDAAQTTLPPWAAAIKAGQLGVYTRLIEEHQPADIPVRLLPAPKLAGGVDIRPLLLGGARRFFYSSTPAVPADATTP